MAKAKIIPFFLPMQGCTKQCIYCDQRAISGQQLPPSAEEIMAALDKLTADDPAELAYYGGSFTCLPLSVQDEYLRLAAPALADGRLSGLRVSTRPDAVDGAVCERLRAQGATTVELGVQSFDAGVLAASGRDYSPERAELASQAVLEAGLVLGLQLMTGLPEDTPEKSLLSAKRAVACGASLLRIYPTLVLRHTPLAALYEAGSYEPQTVEEAVACCVPMLKTAIAAGVTVQRLGVNPSPSVEQALLAGPYHPAFGALVREGLKKEQLQWLLLDLASDEAAILNYPPADASIIFGHKRSTMLWLGQNWPGLALLADPDLPPGSLRLLWDEKTKTCSEAEFCRL